METCCICWSSLCDYTVLLDCHETHQICNHCWDQYDKINCPLCRQKITGHRISVMDMTILPYVASIKFWFQKNTNLALPYVALPYVPMALTSHSYTPTGIVNASRALETYVNYAQTYLA